MKMKNLPARYFNTSTSPPPLDDKTPRRHVIGSPLAFQNKRSRLDREERSRRTPLLRDRGVFNRTNSEIYSVLYLREAVD